MWNCDLVFFLKKGENRTKFTTDNLFDKIGITFEHDLFFF